MYYYAIMINYSANGIRNNFITDYKERSSRARFLCYPPEISMLIKLKSFFVAFQIWKYIYM